ncbi:MAG: type III pantothenate kinase [Vampirovibrio sp.]|nr:type III pantothenate kinase [Vampirovibrio sp.]
MTHLTVDIGNSDLKLGWFQGSRLLSTHRITGWQQLLPKLPTKFVEECKPPVEAENYDLILCSVVPPHVDDVVQAIEQVYGKAHQITIVSPQTPLPKELLIHWGEYPLDQLGADRWVNVVAAYATCNHRPVAVIDFGTATTLNVLGEGNTYLGGMILPGLETFAGILGKKTALLPDLTFQRPDEVLGTSTISCMSSGIYYGYTGLIKEVMAQMRQQFEPKPLYIVATGGMAQVFQDELPSEVNIFDEIDPEWTLKGLSVLYHHFVGQNVASL